MARKTFFSFHYERDAWRAGQVRNSNIVLKDDQYGYVDAVDWETIKRQGVDAIKRWINDQLKSTSVTVVLIGTETSTREWVQYEIEQSWNRGNALIGIFVHGVKDMEQKTDVRGLNPFNQIKLKDGTPLSAYCRTYDWVLEDGRSNMGRWIEEAYQARQLLGDKGKVTESSPSMVDAARPVTAFAAAPGTIKNPSGQWAY